MVYQTADSLDFQRRKLPTVERPRRVLMTTPTHFDVEYVINPHMAEHVGSVQPNVALQQWKALRATYEALDISPLVLEGQPDLPDMVFCANQTLPFYDPETDERGVVLSRMHSAERADEVPYYADFFADQNYRVEALPYDQDLTFEGMGDALWHPGHALLWGGYGFRTQPAAYDAISDLLDIPVLLLELQDPDYYHLDTCFCPLDDAHVLIAPTAFDARGRKLIRTLFDSVVEAPDSEARHQFACNAHCPDGTHVLIQEGCTDTIDRLRQHDFRPIAVDTSEFLKAGGSVFCLKQMIW